MPEISEYRLNELSKAQSDLMKLQKKFNQLDKPMQELLDKIERYEKALNTIAWSYGGASPESMCMSSHAKDALYRK